MIRTLAFASGTCGIAYELVYARLLTTFLGDMFHVAAAILATFLLGIAIGSRVAHRLAGWLWLVEIAIGAIAAAIALVFAGAGDAILEAWLPSTSGAPGAVVALVFALLLAPAALIGCSVPLFALLLRAQSEGDLRESAFGPIYLLYNLGAAGCVLLAEFVVLRSLGIAGTLVLLAGINVATGALLLRARLRVAADGDRRFEAPAAQSAPTAKSALAMLAIAGAASGVYQMSFFKLAETLFGPYHENFALVLALALAGIVAGTAWVERHPVSLSRWLARGACVVALSFLLIHPLVHAFAGLNGALGAIPGASTLLKIAVLAGLGGLPFAIFGGTVPAHVREAPHAAHRAGSALAAAGLGNCVGYLLAVLWLYATFSDRVIAVAIVLALLAAAVLPRLRDVAAVRRPAALALASAALLAAFWPGDLLRYGYETYASLGALRAADRAVSEVRVHRRFDSQISLLRNVDGRETLLINGYTSLVATSGGRTNLREMLYGITPSLYAARRERALVLGVGTGITASATAGVFAHTTAVEVNPSMLELVPHFAEHNGDLAENPAVDLVLDDGLSALLRSSEPYDAIVNTVTSPLYFSSSKLYTRDFFRVVSRRLAPGGVYAMWFDGQVTRRGGEIVFRTLTDSFADCAVTFLNTTYLQVLCANEKLRPRDPSTIEWPADLRRRIADHRLGLDIPAILRALSFPAPRIFEIAWAAPLNTFDRPVLEFLMAGTSISRQAWWSPYAMIDLDLASSPFSAGAPEGGAQGDRCYLLRVLGFHDVDACLGGLDDRQERAIVAAYSDRIGVFESANGAVLGSGERAVLARRLIEGGELDRADALLRAASPDLLRPGRFASLRAQIREARGEGISNATLNELYAQRPLDTEVRSLLARELARRGDTDAALAQIRFASALGPPRPEDRALEAELRARLGSARRSTP